jgi:GntR family transcriptional regulator
MKRLDLPTISPAAPGPLYQQIVEGIRRAVVEGRLKPGEPLPSFRALAEQLLVSLITVKRAYEELEREGVIFRKQGLGTFVAPQADATTRNGKIELARELFAQAVREAEEAGLEAEEIRELFEELTSSRQAPLLPLGERER